MNAKPRIFRTHYPSTGRSYWRVSPVPRRWAQLTNGERDMWNAANAFKEKLTRQESLRLAAQEYIDKYGVEELRLP